MVFSYLDPSNWQHETNHQQEASFNEINHQLPPLPPAVTHHVNNNNNPGSSIRPNSMSERARMANIPQPEGPLKCPRCESTNTKFCYFNNYSLTQPRHFCKGCRRYWTRGGALRIVPVGGGCRKNKKNKSSTSSSSNSSANSAQRQVVNNSSLGIGMQSTEILGNMMPQPSQLPFMPSFGRFGLGNIGSNNLGLNLSGLPCQVDATNGRTEQGRMQFGVAGSELGRSHLALSSGSMDQWRPQQFPFLAGYEAPSGLYNSFQSEGLDGCSSSSLVGYSQLQCMTSNSGMAQQAPMKMEGNHDPKTLFRH